MPSSDRVAFYTEALAAPPLTPKHALRKTFDGGGGKAFQLRVPPDEGALHDLVKRAHASVTGASDYEASMRAEVARLVASRPVFWSKVWPAGLALSRYVLGTAGLCERRIVLELGAGIGIGSVCAAIAGASDVVVTDIEPLGLEYALASARDNGVGDRVRAMAWDWNKPPPTGLGGPFDVILAGDVIYQDEHAPRLAQLLAVLVKPGGLVVFSDSTERPYKGGHVSELAARLADSGFEQHTRQKLAVDAPSGGVAAGKHVQVLVYFRPLGSV